MGKFRFNGWQRFGIVLSILWAIVSCLYIRYEQLQNANERSVLTYNRCKDAPNDAADRQCIADTASTYRMHEGSWGSAAFIALIPIPIAWLLAYGLVFLGRWIRRGFITS
jgi:hypothetical protein